MRSKARVAQSMIIDIQSVTRATIKEMEQFNFGKSVEIGTQVNEDELDLLIATIPPLFVAHIERVKEIKKEIALLDTEEGLQPSTSSRVSGSQLVSVTSNQLSRFNQVDVSDDEVQCIQITPRKSKVLGVVELD